MNKYLLLTLSIFAVLATVNSSVLDDSEDAKLLVAKNILNNYIVEGLDVTIRYNIYNIGNVAALGVKLKDENFPKAEFELVSGFDTVKWARIPPHSNVSHIAVVRPKVPGLFNLTHATVTYTASEKSTKVQTGYSTEIGQVYIQRLRDYNRRFASHTVDWILFVVMTAPSILFPYLLWFNSKRRYETARPSKKTEKSN